jgi:hypothetical protein
LNPYWIVTPHGNITHGYFYRFSSAVLNKAIAILLNGGYSSIHRKVLYTKVTIEKGKSSIVTLPLEQVYPKLQSVPSYQLNTLGEMRQRAFCKARWHNAPGIHDL